MFKNYFVLILVVLCYTCGFSMRAEISYFGNQESLVSTYYPSSDTVFQIDTVYQYEYVYDTIYYYDSVPQSDTVVSLLSEIEESDSSVLVNQTINIVVTENRTIYWDNNNVPLELPGRTFRDIGESERPVIDDRPREVDQSAPIIKKQVQAPTDPRPKQVGLFSISSHTRDTLFRFDTIFNFKVRYDTVKFQRKMKPDTVFSHKKTYEDFGRSVLVKETVTVKITEKKDIFKDYTSGSSKGFSQRNKNKSNRRSNTIVSSKYRNSFDHTPRVGDERTYSGNLRIGLSMFSPDIKYKARNDEFLEEVDWMNDNVNPENSYGLSFTYQYFVDKLGIESGLGFSQQNYSCDYQYQQIQTDSSFYWDYFEKEIFDFDTTWYLDLDRLLQTGDTVFVPNVDSSLIWVSDSTINFDVDTSYVSRNANYHYSFSFLEVPILGHYKLVDKKFHLSVSGGFIPMFLISKSGKFSYPGAGPIIEASQISFDYGFMLSFYASATVGYRFSKRWSVFAEPYIRRNIFSIIQNDNIHLKTNSWGVKAGLSYRLFVFKSK